MIVLDAAAAVALARSEPAAAEVEHMIRSGGAAMSAVNTAEVADVLVRRHAIRLDAFDALLTQFAVRPVSPAEARRAGELRARHYDREHRALSLADCFLLATAREDDAIATSDQAVVDAAHEEGIRVLPLPNSAGVRPRPRR